VWLIAKRSCTITFIERNEIKQAVWGWKLVVLKVVWSLYRVNLIAELYGTKFSVFKIYGNTWVALFSDIFVNSEVVLHVKLYCIHYVKYYLSLITIVSLLYPFFRWKNKCCLSFIKDTIGSPMHIEGGKQSPCRRKREGASPDRDTPLKRAKSIEGTQVN